MGNSSCLLASDVTNFSDTELGKSREEDELCLSLLQQQLPAGDMGRLAGLETYQVLGAAAAKSPAKPEAQELALLCLQDHADKLSDKFTEVRSSLQGELKYLGTKDSSPERRYRNARLQILCRVFDAFLRQEERERRQAEASKQADKKKDARPKDVLPPLARAGLGFGLEVLLKLVEAVGITQPHIISATIDIAASVMQELKPLSLVGVEPALQRSVDSFSQFFAKLLSAGLDRSTNFKAAAVMLGLALAKGDYTAALALVQNFLSAEPCPEWASTVPMLAPLLGNLQGMKACKGIKWSWFPERQGPDIVMSNENLTITRTNSSGWGNQKSEQKISDGIHYVEMKIDRNSSSCLCIGVCATSVTDFSSKCSFANCICYQADGDSYKNGSSVGNIGSFTAGDRIGMLIDMEEHKISFYKNGTRMPKDPYDGVLPEVQLIICFGGSDQFVTINNDPELPGDVVGLVSLASKKDDEEVPPQDLPFPVKPEDVIKDSEFKPFLELSGEATPSTAASFILATLVNVGESVYSAFALDSMQPKYPKSIKLTRSNGLAVEVQPKTFALLIDILATLKRTIETRDWRLMTFKQAALASLSAMRLLRNNIFTSIKLSLTEEESGLTADMKQTIKTILSFFSTLSLANIGVEVTEDSKAARDALDHQSLLVILHSFELFFPTLNSQLEYVITTLGTANADDAERRLATDVLKKLSQPSNLFRAFNCTTEEDRERVQKFVMMVTARALENTEKFLKGEAEAESELVQSLFVCQAALFSQVAKTANSSQYVSLLKEYMQHFLSGLHSLLNVLWSLAPEGQISEELEGKIKQTVLDRVVITLLRSLSVLKFDAELSAFLITELTQLSAQLSSFKGGKTELTTGTTLTSQIYESEHPYPNSADQTHSVRVPGAIFYTLTFDQECKTENNYDYLQLYPNASKSTELYKWMGDRSQFPQAPVVVKQPELFFTFHSDGSTNYWGWKIIIEATLEVTISKEGWTDELRNAVSLLLVILCKNLVAVEKQDKTPVETLLGTQLLKGGIHDIGLFRISKAKPALTKTLSDLITSTQLEEASRSISGSGVSKTTALQKRQEAKPSLISYLPKLASADMVATQYCDISIVDELIAGSSRVKESLADLKEQAKVTGPVANLGGTELDQAERALLGVYVAFFEISNSFISVVEDPLEAPEMILYMVKQANQVRAWAQQQRQKALEAGKEVSYSDLAKDIVQKCILLLHCDYKHALNDIGIDKVLQSFVVTIKRAQSVMEESKVGSKWKVVQKAAATVGRMKTLQGLRVMRGAAGPLEDEQGEEKKQFLGVAKLVMEVLGTGVGAADIVEELGKRRNRAAARCTGLNLMAVTFKVAPELARGELQGLISSAFSDSFCSAGLKKHYISGTEGTDPYLLSCLQRSFFQLYSILLNRLSADILRDKDCTSEAGTQAMLSTFEALSFPFEASDSGALLDLNLAEPVQFLLAWAKGQHFYEQLQTKFDRSKVLVDLIVLPEADFHAESGTTACSLNPKNRLEGEVAEEVEGQQKLALVQVSGTANAELLPITELLVASSSEPLEGWTKVEGNINELGLPERTLFIKRGEICDGGNYLTNVIVSDWDPIGLAGETQSYSALQSINVSPEEVAKRADRKDLLRRSAWLLFKLLMFASAGKYGDAVDTVHDRRRADLQKLFADVLLAELKCTSRKPDTEESLELRKLISGKLWRKGDIPTTDLRVSAMADWVGKIREDAEEYLLRSADQPQGSEVSFTDLISDYVAQTDPELQGHVTANQDLYRNAAGEADFFCFLRYVVAHAGDMLGPFWQKYVRTSKLIQSLPTDFFEAEKGVSGGTVASILSSFLATINPNEDDSFLPYLQLFSVAEQPGLVPKDQAPKECPSDFFNPDGQLDFFAAFKAVTSRPDQYPNYFRELKMFLRAYNLPKSCAEYYKASLSSQQAEYQASLLLLLHQCCASKGMLAVLGAPQALLELLKHMFCGSLKASTIAFRIVKDLVASEHSPESFEGLWTSFPKANLRSQYGEEAASSLVLMLLTFIGVKSCLHIKSSRYVFLSAEKIEALAFEALGFLQSLCQNNRWREHIMKTCLGLVTKALVQVPTEAGSETTIGAIGFLKNLDGRRNVSIHEWSKVELKGAGMSHGILIKHKKAAGRLKLYCEGDDALHTESAETFVSTVPESKLFLYGQLPERLVAELFATLTQLVVELDDPRHNRSATSVEMRINNAAARRLVQSSAMEILASLCDTPHALQAPDISSFVSRLITCLDTESSPSIPDVLYYQLRKIVYSRHKNIIAPAAKTAAEPVVITDEEKAKIIATYNEERQLLVALCDSIGLDFADIKEAIDKGNNDSDAVVKYIEQRNASLQAKVETTPLDNLLLYKLGKSDRNVPVFKDFTGTAGCSESAKGHLCISAGMSSNGEKQYWKLFEESMFANLDKTPEEMTILAAVGFSDLISTASFSLKVGNLAVPISISQQEAVSGTADKNHFFRLFLSFDGHVSVHKEATGELLFESEEGFSFEDVATTRYGLSLSTPGKVELKGFAVFSGHYKGTPTYWEEEAKDQPSVPGKFVPFKPARANTTTSALISALGVDYPQAVALSQRHPELKQALKAMFAEQTALSPLVTDYGSFIVDMTVADSVEQLSPGFTKVPIYADRKESSDYFSYFGKAVGVKTAEERGAVFVKSIEIKDEALSFVKEEKGQGTGVVAVLVLKVTDPMNVELPAGYMIVGEEGRGLNLTPDTGSIHFLAYRTSFNFRQHPFTDFSQMTLRSSDSGLVDSFDPIKASTQEFDSKRVAEETAAFNAQSTVQLHTRLATLEKGYKKEACFKLVLKLLKRWTDCITDVDQLAKLLEASGRRFALLKPAVEAVFLQPALAPLMADALLEDVLTQLISSVFGSTESSVSSKTLQFESTHPYENNLDKTGEIRIPGAKKLIFTFDPQCKSENNYDYLQFCKDSNYQQEIKKHTGTTWPNFEVDGDTVYWKFHSDGSNNDWGYKFTVIGAVRVAAAAAEGATEDDVARALWTLEALIFNQPALPTHLTRFQGKELQNALTLFAHSTTDQDTTLRALFLLKQSLEIPAEASEDAMAIVDLLFREATTQYRIEQPRPEKSSLLKDVVGLILELKDKYNLELKAEWFLNFYETFCFLKGVDTKDEHYQFLLLKQFLELHGRSLDVVRESAHPYAAVFTSRELYTRGSNLIQVEFTKDSEADPDHCILFSSDPDCTQPIFTLGSTSVPSSVEWATSPAGPNIAISNGGKSVTRTDSSGWGTVLTNTTFNSGKVKFTFKIDNDGGSSYLYIGVLAVNPTSLSECTYKDWAHPCWVYKRTGEFHRHGFSAENTAHAYNTNDEISMLLDFDEHTVTFFKSGAQVHQLTDLVGPVVGSACFGGSGQHVSIVSVESAGGDASRMSDLKMVLTGDKVFYHFPVNAGYLTHLQTRWNSDKQTQVAFSDENKSFTRPLGNTDHTIVLSNTTVRSGRQFLEVEATDLPVATAMSFGLGLPDQPLAIAYQSDGVLKKFGESFMVEGYRQGDSIALLLNVPQAELRVFKNGVQLIAVPRVTLEEGKDFRWGVDVNGQAAVQIKTAAPWTSSLDLIGRGINGLAISKYGYKFTARPTYMGKNKRIAFEALGNLQGDWESFLRKQTHLFSKEVCEQLVNYVDEKCNNSDKDPMSLKAEELAPTPAELVHYDLLEKLTVEDIRSVFKLIKDLNVQVTAALPLISLDLKESAVAMTQLQQSFLHLRGFLFLKSKNKTLKDFLGRTNTSDQPTIEINRTRALRQKEKGVVDTQGVSSIYGQIYRHMNKYANRSLRHAERIYRVNFLGEGSIDGGGPYNEVMSNMCEELMSSYLPLFVPCPNNVHSLGENRDAWVPNPSGLGSRDLYVFLGKLFGVAIRTQNNLNLSLAPIFWKRLIFDDCTTADVKGFDECIYQTLAILRHPEEQDLNKDNFAAAFGGETFTTRDSSGALVELCPGGSTLQVTFENASEYADLLERQRLTEAADVYAAIRQGMSAVVPMHLIYLFSWKQVETLVCGAADINVDVLKGNTVYDGLNETSPQIVMFWEVFREMTGRERSLFLRFVWGRSRLPAGKDFKQFKITNKSVSGNPDGYLPHSHTCFFTIDLPPYSTKPIMREKIVYAITHCQAIDLDRVVGAEGWEDE